MLSRERDKLEKALGGIKDMGGVPDLVFVIDTNKEALAIKEANRLKIPVIAILDTNCDPDGIAFPIPGNDDASRAIQLYCDLVARAAIDGISRSQGAAGVDLGEAEAPIAEAAARAGRARGARRPRTSISNCSTAPRGAPDDLAKLTGVGPQIVKKLNEHGVFHYWQLAAMTPDEAAEARRRSAVQRPHHPRQWVDQARDADRRRVSRRASRALRPVGRDRECGAGRRVFWISAAARSRTAGAMTVSRKTMAAITAALVKDLREKTGAGMMDCKNALSETAGDIEAAIDWLRKKGLAKAAKKSGRVAADGLVGVAVEAQCRRRRRSELRDRLRRPQRRLPGSGARRRGRRARQGRRCRRRDACSGAHYPGGGTVAEAIANAIATIGENMTLRRAAGPARRRRRDRPLRPWPDRRRPRPHRRHRRRWNSKGDSEKLAALGRQIAMHVAAASPIALNAEGRRSRDGRARTLGAGREERRKTTACDGEDHRIRDSRPSTRRSACSISLTCTIRPGASLKRSRRRRRRSARRSRSLASSGSSAARAWKSPRKRPDGPRSKSGPPAAFFVFDAPPPLRA